MQRSKAAVEISDWIWNVTSISLERLVNMVCSIPLSLIRIALWHLKHWKADFTKFTTALNFVKIETMFLLYYNQKPQICRGKETRPIYRV